MDHSWKVFCFVLFAFTCTGSNNNYKSILNLYLRGFPLNEYTSSNRLTHKDRRGNNFPNEVNDFSSKETTDCPPAPTENPPKPEPTQRSFTIPFPVSHLSTQHHTQPKSTDTPSTMSDSTNGFSLSSTEFYTHPEFKKPSSTTPKLNQLQLCQETHQTINNETITWPNTESGRAAVSQPLCLDESLKIMKRQCNGDWYPAPNCSSIQQPISPCPPELKAVNDGRFCYSIITNTSFPPRCPYPEPLSWDEYVILGILPNEPVWMPLERVETTEYGTDVFRYTELSDKYRSPFYICTQSCRTFFYKGTFLDKRCQVYHNSTHIEAVRCDDKYAAICIYNALPHKQSSLCQQIFKESCKQGSYQPNSICFCETRNQDIGAEVLAEFILPYQNLLFREKSCRIGLKNQLKDSSNNFIWETSEIPVNYTYWSASVDFKYEHGMITSEGWKLKDSSPECSIYQIEPSTEDGKLQLDVEDNYFKLNITNFKSFFSRNNKDPLVYCFTDADAKTVIYRMNDLTGETEESNYVIKFAPIDVEESGPGYYWCQAFQYPDLSVITSNPKIIRNFSAEYVAILRLKHYENKLSAYPLTPENLEMLQNLFKNELPNSVSFYPRIFRINKIDEARKEVDITFHLTSASAVNTEEEYETLKNICKTQSMFELLDFRSVDYCPQDITLHEGQKIIWPLKVLDNKTSPLNGHCVTQNAELVQRTCIGNFIDGVYWTDISNVNCQLYPGSSLTDKLIDILGKFEDDNKLNSTLEELSSVTESYDTFSTLDFVLTTNFIRNISSKKLNLEIFAGMVSNLMMVPRAVLLSAQLNFKATDILLKTIDRVLENSNFVEYKKPNFAIKSLDISEGIRGVYLQNCNNYTDCSLTAMANLSLLYNANIIATKNIDAAISLSSELYEQIITYSKKHESYTPRMIVSVFYGSQLFVELGNAKSSNLVFGVLLPDFPEAFLGPISLYYYTDIINHWSGYNCSFWRFNETDLGTWEIEKAEKVQGAVICEFDHITNFGTPFTVSRTTKFNKINASNNNMQMCIPDDEATKKCFTKKEDYLFCTIIDRSTPFDQFCLIEHSTVIPTECFENSTIVEDVHDNLQKCTKYPLSVVMKKALENIEGNAATIDPTIELLRHLTASSENITETDLLFVALFLSKIPTKPVDLAEFVGIVNNLMKVPKSVLYNAQKSFKAVGILPNLIENVLVTAECKEWRTEGFAVKCLEISDNKGVLLENCSETFTDCDFRTVQYYSDSLASNNASYSLIILSEGLYNQIMGYKKLNSAYIPKLIISVYYGTQLFVDTKTDSSLFNTVFGLLLPDFSALFQGPILIYYFKDVDYIKYSCSYWRVDENANGSWMVEYNSLRTSITLCKYFHLSHFAVNINSPKQSYNAKIRSNKAFYSAKALRDGFNTQLSFVSDHCNINEYFANILGQIYTYGGIIFNCSSEVEVSNIFNKACFNNKLEQLNNTRCYHGYRKSAGNSDLPILHNNTIPNLASANYKETLTQISRESENLNSIEQPIDIENALSNNAKELNKLLAKELFSTLIATGPFRVTLEMLANVIDLLEDATQDVILENADVILYNMDTILEKARSTNMVRKENFVFITVSPESIKYFQGFSITRTRDILCIFQKNYFRTPEDDIDVSVVIGPKLRSQIQEANSSIVFAIFYSTSLFPSPEKPTVRLPIIEVLIPDLHDELEGDITIKYKNKLHGKCCYWDNEVIENNIHVSGYWKQESNAEVEDDTVTCNFQHVTHFALVATSQNVTNDLEEIMTANLSSLEKLKQVNSITTLNYNYLVPMDIFLISQIIAGSLTEEDIPRVITNIVSSLFMVSREVLRQAQQTHSATDIILYAVDEMSRRIDDLESHHTNFSLIVRSLNSTNLTGILLYNCEYYECAIAELTHFINISDYSNNSTLSAMVIFSEELLCQIRNQTDTKVAIAIYYSDILFNEIDLERKTTVIFGIIFPGLTDVLTGPVSVVYNMDISSKKDLNQCAYWFYKPDLTGNNATLGTWMNDNNKTHENKLAICIYSHVTHFGMLLANDDDYDDDTILDLITDIGCVFSLFGIIVILITAMLFKKWRQNTGNQLLMNFSIAISIKIVTLYVSVYIKNNSSGIICTITGVVLHYSILSECNWMLTVAILQFKRFVEVLSRPPKYILVKALICGWIFPIFPVLCVIVIDPDNYKHGFANLCYPSDLGLYLGIWLPVLIILTINCVIFIFIIYNVFHKKTEFIDRTNHEILFQWRLAFLLFFMLGLNWAFGFLGQIKGDVLFIYLYSLSASLQGFILFLFFIVFNKGTRFLYSHCIKQWFYARGIFKVWHSKSSSNY